MKTKLNHSTAAAVLSLAVMAVLIVGRLVGITFGKDDNTTAYLSVVILELMAFVLPAIFYCKMQKTDYIFALKMKLFGLEKIVFVLFCAVFMICALTTAKFAMQEWFHITAKSEILFGISVPGTAQNALDSTYLFVVFALIPAVAEEFLFRGVLFTEFEHAGIGVAVILSSVMYGLVHFSLGSFLVYFLSGVILCFAVYVTGSLFSAMIIHVFYNLYTMFFEDYIWSFVSKPDGMLFFLFVAISLLLLFGALTFGEAQRQQYTRAVQNDPVPAYVKKNYSMFRALTGAFFTWPMLVCLALFVLSVILL